MIHREYSLDWQVEIVPGGVMKPKDCFRCKQSKITGSCTIFFCELLQRQVWGYSVDKDCPLGDSAEKEERINFWAACSCIK